MRNTLALHGSHQVAHSAPNLERNVRCTQGSSCRQLPQECNHLARSLRSSPITGPSSLLRIGPPQCSASVLSPHGFRRLCVSLNIRALVPAVPCKSLHPIHALSTPIAACPVIRHPTDFIPVAPYASGFDDVWILNDASSKGSLSFVSRLRTCSRYCLEL